MFFNSVNNENNDKENDNKNYIYKEDIIKNDNDKQNNNNNIKLNQKIKKKEIPNIYERYKKIQKNIEEDAKLDLTILKNNLKLEEEQ